MDGKALGLAGAWVGLVVTFGGGTMKLGAAEEKIRQLEADRTTLQEQQKLIQRDITKILEQSGRVDERTKAILRSIQSLER